MQIANIFKALTIQLNEYLNYIVITFSIELVTDSKFPEK